MNSWWVIRPFSGVFMFKSFIEKKKTEKKVYMSGESEDLDKFLRIFPISGWQIRHQMSKESKTMCRTGNRW